MFSDLQCMKAEAVLCVLVSQLNIHPLGFEDTNVKLGFGSDTAFASLLSCAEGQSADLVSLKNLKKKASRLSRFHEMFPVPWVVSTMRLVANFAKSPGKMPKGFK